MNPLAGLVTDVRPPVEPAEKIAVLRANGIGDYVFALPALESLRAAYPTAEIVLIGAPWHREVLAGRNGPVDRFETAPPLPGIRRPLPHEEQIDLDAWSAEFFSAMRAERFDLAVQMHGGGVHSNPFVRQLEPRVSAGLGTEDAEKLDRTLPFYYYQHEVVRFLEVSALAGAAPLTLTPRWHVAESERLQLAEVLDGRPAPDVVLNPGAGDARRRWPPEKFADTGDRLVASGASVAVAGDEDDRPLAAAIGERMRFPVLDLSGRLTLPALGALFEQASVVVSNDSGPLHLARATGARTVGIYWCGNLINAGPLANARHRVALTWRLRCPLCGADCIGEGCAHDASFVADVAVDEVAQHALSLWQEAAANRLREWRRAGRQLP